MGTTGIASGKIVAPVYKVKKIETGGMSTANFTAKVNLRRLIDRQWSAHLSSSEMKVVNFIFSVTQDWGKDYERIKYDHFLHGVGAHQGVGLSQSTLQRALKSLWNRGSIGMSRGSFGKTFWLIPDWEPIGVSMLKTPKNVSKKVVENELKSPKMTGQNDQSRVVKMTSHILERDTPRKGHTDSSAPTASARVPLVEIVEQAKEQHAKAALAKRDKLRANKKNLSVFWTSVYAECHPEAPANFVGGKDQGQLLHLTRSTNIDPFDFVDWIVREWSLIMAARFAWMEQSPPPANPSIAFALRFKEKFYDAWWDREVLRKEVTLSHEERQRRRLVRKGYSDDEAAKHLQSVRDAAEKRTEKGANRRRLDAILRQADDERKHRPPVQPDSQRQARDGGGERGPSLASRTRPVQPGSAQHADDRALDPLPDISWD